MPTSLVIIVVVGANVCFLLCEVKNIKFILHTFSDLFFFDAKQSRNQRRATMIAVISFFRMHTCMYVYMYAWRYAIVKNFNVFICYLKWFWLLHIYFLLSFIVYFIALAHLMAATSALNLSGKEWLKLEIYA